MPIRVRVPVAVVAAGGLPAVCSRHGETATFTCRVTVLARPPVPLTILLLALGMLPYVVVASRQPQRRLPVWPFCHRCRRWRRTGLLTGATALVLGAAALYRPVRVPAGGDLSPTMNALLIGGLALVILGLVGTVAFATWTLAARATLSRDEQWVRIRAHPEFAAAATVRIGTVRIGTAR